MRDRPTWEIAAKDALKWKAARNLGKEQTCVRTEPEEAEKTPARISKRERNANYQNPCPRRQEAHQFPHRA